MIGSEFSIHYKNDSLYRNIRTISEEVRLKRQTFSVHMVIDRMTRRVWKTWGGREKGLEPSGLFNLVRKDWIEILTSENKGIGYRSTNEGEKEEDTKNLREGTAE